MKNQPEHISKLQDKVEEIRLAQEQISLAITDAKGVKKALNTIYSQIVDLKGLAAKSKDQKLQGLLQKLDKAHSDVDAYLLDVPSKP